MDDGWWPTLKRLYELLSEQPKRGGGSRFQHDDWRLWFLPILTVINTSQLALNTIFATSCQYWLSVLTRQKTIGQHLVIVILDNQAYSQVTQDTVCSVRTFKG